MKAANKMPVVMTVAGSDSGGGAGIQADLKVFAALNVFATTAITCVTAQNPAKVAGVDAIDSAMVALQIKTVFSAFPVKAVKTGMLYSAGVIRAVAGALARRKLNILVVDPVMVATAGGRLIQKHAFIALCSEILPLATVITPNIPEAEQLCNIRITNLDEMKNAAMTIQKKFGAACVLKGGHLDLKTGQGRDDVVDVLCCGRDVTEFRTRRVVADNTHGTGCRFSAALTAYLAKGETLNSAVGMAQKFVSHSLQDQLYIGTETAIF